MSFLKLRGADTAAERVSFTAAADVVDGDVVVIGDRVGVAFGDTATGETGVAYVRTDEKGILMPNAAVASAQHASAYWDADGDPVGGTAGTGAVTNVPTDNTFIGYFAEATADTDEEAVVHLTGA
ncbi:MAG: DUF2190 family protein [Bacteroidota bacterium]